MMGLEGSCWRLFCEYDWRLGRRAEEGGCRKGAGVDEEVG